MQIILLLTTLISIAFLTIYRAGMSSWSLLLVATILSGVTCLAYFLKTKKSNTKKKCSVGRPSPQGGKPQSKQRDSANATKDQRPTCHAVATKCEGGRPATKNLFSLPLLHVAIIIFILLTLIPLPKPLTIVTGAERYRQNVVAEELIEKAEKLEICKPSFSTFSITRNRAGTMRVLLLIVAMYGIFEAVRHLSLRNRIIYLHILIALGLVVAVAGHLSCSIYPQGEKLWWLFSVPPFHRPPVGCFLNANHYAGFIAILSITALGCTVMNIRSRRWILAALTTSATFVMVFFVIISASRGAILALSAGLFSMVIAFVIHLKGRTRLISIFAIIICVAIGTLFALQNEKVCSRISTLRHPHSDSGVQPRLAAWGGALRLWTHYPVLGVGANAFRFTYPQHKTTEFRAYRRFAENEFLHILAEGGLTGLILTSLLLLLIASKLRQSAASTTIENSLVICVIGVIITGVAHASVDFILHLPLYAVMLASIIATGIRKDPPQKYQRTAIVMTLVICFGLMPLTTSMTKYDNSGYIVTASNDKLASLMRWSPTNPQVLRRFGANIAQLETPATDRLSEEFLEQAAKYDPGNFNIWIKLGKLRLKSNNKSGAKEAFSKATAIRSWAPVPKID